MFLPHAWSWNLLQIWGSINGDASGGMRHIWQGIESNRAAFVLSLLVGVARALWTLITFFIAIDSDDILSGGNTLSNSFVGSLFDFVAPHQINGRSKLTILLDNA
jgi:hypothetical protein